MGFVKQYSLLVSICLLLSCGGGGGGDSESPETNLEDPQLQPGNVKGSVVKGPLASAELRAYQLDYAAVDLKGALVGAGATDNKAEIVGLNLEAATAPFLLVATADGDTVDLTTNSAPVITELSTIISADAINNGTPIYATPLTTLALSVLAEQGTTEGSFFSDLEAAQNQVKSTFGFGMDSSIDLFTASPVLSDETDTLAEQTEVAEYRLAVEAVTAVLFEAAGDTASATDTPNDVLSALALDLADGSIDGMDGSNPIAKLVGVDVTSDPVASLVIPGTSTLVSDIETVLASETSITGTSATLNGGVSVSGASVMTQSDVDFDGVADVTDNCPGQPNSSQTDNNSNDVGLACEEQPGVQNIVAATQEDQPVSITLLGSFDPEGDTLIYTVDGNMLTAGVSSYNYQAAANAHGQFILQYSVSDGEQSSSNGTITISVSPENDFPTGTVEFSGEAIEGEELTASNTLADADGLGAISYEWFVDSSSVGTGSTYTLQVGQAGLDVFVRASYTDLDGTNESVDSSSETIDLPGPSFDSAKILSYEYIISAPGDFSEHCPENTFFYKRIFDVNGDLHSTSSCAGSEQTGSWMLEEGDRVLKLDAAIVEDPIYLVANGDELNNAQPYCQVSHSLITSSEIAIDLCENMESSSYWAGTYGALGYPPESGSWKYGNTLAESHAASFNATRFSKLWLAGRSLYRLWYGDIDTTGNGVNDSTGAGLDILEFSSDGSQVSITGLSGSASPETTFDVTVTQNGSIYFDDQDSKVRTINFMGNTDDYLEIKGHQFGLPSSERYYHDLTTAQSDFSSLSASVGLSFRKEQLTQSYVYSVYLDSGSGELMIRRLEFKSDDTGVATSRLGSAGFESIPGFETPENFSYVASGGDLTITGTYSANIQHSGLVQGIQSGGIEVCVVSGLCVNGTEWMLFSERAAQNLIDNIVSPFGAEIELSFDQADFMSGGISYFLLYDTSGGGVPVWDFDTYTFETNGSYSVTRYDASSNTGTWSVTDGLLYLDELGIPELVLKLFDGPARRVCGQQSSLGTPPDCRGFETMYWMDSSALANAIIPNHLPLAPLNSVGFFSHEGLAGRVMYNVSYGDIDGDGDGTLDSIGVNLNKLTIAPDGKSFNLESVAVPALGVGNYNASPMVPNIPINIDHNGAMWNGVEDTGVRLLIHALGSTADYIQAYAYDNGELFSVERFYDDESKALAFAGTLTAPMIPSFNPAQVVGDLVHIPNLPNQPEMLTFNGNADLNVEGTGNAYNFVGDSNENITYEFLADNVLKVSLPNVPETRYLAIHNTFDMSLGGLSLCWKATQLEAESCLLEENPTTTFYAPFQLHKAGAKLEQLSGP